MPQEESFNFSAFVNELIENTMDAILISHINQEKKVLEIIEDINMSKAELIEKYNLLEEAEEILGKNIPNNQKLKFIDDYIADHKTIIKKFTDKGIPKVIVENGKLKVKAVISIDENEQAPIDLKQNEKKEGPTKKIDLKQFKNLQTNLSQKVFQKQILPAKDLSKTPRIKISPIKENSSVSESTFDITSEIELEFKTVIE